MDTNQLPLVSIQCLVYNHEPYLRQCLDGFVMQQTNFKFEAIIHDDVSTDGSAEIIREYAEKYPDIIKPIYETENQYSKRDGSLDKIMNNACKGKYIAFCEGDDYWTDPYKLQKQINILESSHEYGLCYTKAKVYNQSKNLFENYYAGKAVDNPLTEIFLKGNFIPTLTVLVRKVLLYKYLEEIKPESHNWLMGDLPIWIWFIINSKIKYIDENTAVYRLLENSASHSNDIKKEECFFTSSKEIRLFYISHYKQYSHWFNQIYDLYYGTLLRIGEKYKERKYCLRQLSKIQTKSKSEKIKFLLYHIPFVFYIIRNKAFNKIIKLDWYQNKCNRKVH